MAFRFAYLILMQLVLLGTPARADRIILRNLDVIRDRTVERFDEDGVRLDDGTILTWDRIEKGRVAADQQARFDQLLGELGVHLYRLRSRLANEDYRGLLPHAEALYDRYADRRGPTAYMVLQSLMWSRLATGRREEALVPFFQCFECLRAAAADKQPLGLPGDRRLKVDMRTGLADELPPVWFDASAARRALKPAARAISRMQAPHPPAARVYYATLALAAGDAREAEQALSGLEGLDSFKTIVTAQLRLQQGDARQAITSLESLSLPADAGPKLKPLTLYWLGRARLAEADKQAQREGMLDLLQIAALFGARQPELAAAGLYETMQALARSGDVKESIAVRRELLDRYGQTWHAAKLRADDKKVKR